MKFFLTAENQPLSGCTISNKILASKDQDIYCFSLADSTSISQELYSYRKLFYNLAGDLIVLIDQERIIVHPNELITTPKNSLVGVKTTSKSIFLEINLEEEKNMNSILKDKQVFQLKDLLPYQEGKIINMDLVNEEKTKFVLMSFTKGTALKEHAAPGEALIIALDGEGIIGYEGKEYILHAGDNFKFEKFGKHYVKAEQNFKMALLLVLD